MVPSLLRVTIWVVVAVTVHVLSVKKLYVTVPVGVNPLTRPPRLAVSYADAPVFSFPLQGLWVTASSTTVLVVLDAAATLNSSQPLVDPL